MSKAVQRRFGTTAEHADFTGISGEFTYNTTTKAMHTHDGVTSGGFSNGGYMCPDETHIRSVSAKLGDYITAYDFGAKGDYYLEDGTVNPSPTPDQDAIQAAYAYCVDHSKVLVLDGDFYTNASINFGYRAGAGSGMMRIHAACTIHANLDAGGTNAVYVGDDTTNGTYPITISGQFDIVNAGAVVLTKVGFRAQDAAYGYWCVTASGFEYGIYIQGCIYCTLDGGHRACHTNYQDIRIESYRSTNPVPILRFTNNILEVKNIRLASKAKLAIVVGATVAAPYQHTGGLIRFDRVLFEGASGIAPSVPYTVYVERTAETTEPYTSEVTFSHCWFEAFHLGQPLLAIASARVILRNCFIAHYAGSGIPIVQLRSENAYIEFDCTNGYFGDAAPTYMVTAAGSATAAHRSNITVRSSNFYGPSGTLVPLHSGFAGGYRYLSYSTPDGSKAIYMRFDNVSPKYPANTSDDYMKDATLNVADFVQAHFGTGVTSADIYIGATDGGSSMSAHVVYLPNKSYIAYTSDASLTISAGVLSFPTSTLGQFYRPLVHAVARVFEQTYALA